jgi:hypothetical protein
MMVVYWAFAALGARAATELAANATQRRDFLNMVDLLWKVSK